ncbi:MAG: SUF system Fe-S cluster assembly protein [Alphaproteobacteria bacterium]
MAEAGAGGAGAGIGHAAIDGSESGVARAGKPRAPGLPPASWEAVADALRTVYDPEIPVNIFELGLIYKLEVADDGKVAIEMTLTAPACPVAGTLPGQVAETVAQVPGAGEVEVKLVWEPPWTPQRMSEDARMVLDIP